MIEESLRINKETADRFLDKLRAVPCGRRVRGKGRTLYDDILSLGLTEGDIWEIASQIGGFVAQVEYGKALVSARMSFNKDTTFNRDRFEGFMEMLTSQNPQLLAAVIAGVNQDWKEKILRCVDTIEKYLQLEQKRTSLLSSTTEKIREETKVGEGWTNLPKVGLNSATTWLCEFFLERTGNPHYGIIGQLLYQATLEVETTSDNSYRVLSNRVKRRFQRLR